MLVPFGNTCFNSLRIFAIGGSQSTPPTPEADAAVTDEAASFGIATVEVGGMSSPSLPTVDVSKEGAVVAAAGWA